MLGTSGRYLISFSYNHWLCFYLGIITALLADRIKKKYVDDAVINSWPCTNCVIDSSLTPCYFGSIFDASNILYFDCAFMYRMACLLILWQ